MADETYYHVETMRTDGTWHTFTAMPIAGREAAEKQLAYVRENLFECRWPFSKTDPAHVRLHELTPLDMVKHLTVEERENLVAEYIKSLPPGEFWRMVAEARERNEAERQEAKTA
jgi:hypothetical protein